MDVLTGHKDLCERLEKGLAQDHQTALAKMLSLKKRKIQGVIKGADVSNSKMQYPIYNLIYFYVAYN